MIHVLTHRDEDTSIYIDIYITINTEGQKCADLHRSVGIHIFIYIDTDICVLIYKNR